MANCRKCNREREYKEMLDLSQRVDIEAAGSFSIVKPIASTNLFPNGSPYLTVSPGSFGAGAGGQSQFFQVMGGGTAQFSISDPGIGRFGPTAHTIDVSSGAIGMITTISPVPYVLGIGTYRMCVSVKAECGADMVFQLSTATDILAFKVFEATGDWQQICICFSTTENIINPIWSVQQAANGQAPSEDWHVAGWYAEEVEECDDCNKNAVFFDGFSGFDWPGLKGADFRGNEGFFSWDGDALESPSTSGRFSGAAGEMIPLDCCGLTVTGYSGLGHPDPRNVSQAYGKQPGAYFQDRTLDEQEFSIIGRFSSRDLRELHCMRSRLLDSLRDCSNIYRDLRIIRYKAHDACGNPCGREYEMIGSFEGGMAGDITAVNGEDVEIRFKMHSPYVRSVDQRDYRTTIGGAGTVTYRLAICNKGTAAAQPLLIFNSDDTGSFVVHSVTNDDTGQAVQFNTAVSSVNGPETIIVSTQFDNSYARSTTRPNVSGFTDPCSDDATFELACGINHLTIRLDNVVNPSYGDPTVTPPFNRILPSFRIVYRELFTGIDTACCEGESCNQDDVLPGYTYLG